MTLSLRDISDRLEIQDALTAYSTAVDGGRFDDLRTVFTTDAHIDYSATGGITGTLDECIAWLGEVLPAFSAYCHFLGNVDIRIDGGTATSRTLCLNPMQTPDSSAFLLGIYYDDDWARTVDGWRITTRTLVTKFHKQL
ncbi:nuclear transport factor 2 family protein [Gordonia sp. CPCC 205333]|uniref:nuclear transport factor 2 family protein n=1 Tax=Gordonia sp. CPCC 205333 TaxID=3140790 RepID=UPI003AF33865